MRYGIHHLVLAGLAGLVVGLLAIRMPHSRGPAARERRLNHLSRKLELSPEQKDQVKAAFERGGERMEALRAQTREEVRALLTQVQRETFDRMMARRDRAEGRDTLRVETSSNTGAGQTTKPSPGEQKRR